MGIGTSTRASVRQIITDLGSDASLYPFASATKTTNSEGDTTVSDWGGATAIKIISSNHFAIRRIPGNQGEESNEGDRVLLVRDDVTIDERDKVTISDDSYIVQEVKKMDPIENILIYQRVVLAKDANY